MSKRRSALDKDMHEGMAEQRESASFAPTLAQKSIEADWPMMPTETEIYILPDGQVVIADLPAELAPLVADLGVVKPCIIEENATKE